MSKLQKILDEAKKERARLTQESRIIEEKLLILSVVIEETQRTINKKIVKVNREYLRKQKEAR